MDFNFQMCKKVAALVAILVTGIILTIFLVNGGGQALYTFIENTFNSNSQIVQDSENSNVINVTRVTYDTPSFQADFLNNRLIVNQSGVLAQYMQFDSNNSPLARIRTDNALGLRYVPITYITQVAGVNACCSEFSFRAYSRGNNIHSDWDSFSLSAARFHSVSLVGSFLDIRTNNAYHYRVYLYRVTDNQSVRLTEIIASVGSQGVDNPLKRVDLLDFDLPAGQHRIQLRSTAEFFAVHLGVPNLTGQVDAGIVTVSQLAAPVIELIDGYVRWQAVQGAVGYRVFIGNATFDTTATSFSLQNAPGGNLIDANLFVRAIGNVGARLVDADTMSVANNLTSMMFINFIINGQVVHQYLASYGTRVPLPVPPVIYNHEFSGWFTCSNFNTQVTENTLVTRNMTVYARFRTISIESAQSNDVPTWLIVTLATVGGLITIGALTLVARKKFK